MPSDLQVSNIKDLTGSNTGLSIASDGQVTISQNNPTITLGANTTFPAGHVLQTVGDHWNTEVPISATDYQVLNASFKVDITPASASHKVLVMFTNPSYSNGSDRTMGITLFRSISGGASNVDIGGTNWGFAVTVSGGGTVAQNACATYLDSPNTDQQITYQIAHKVTNTSHTGYSCINSSKATIIAMEIKA